MEKIIWRDLFMALVNRTESKQLNVTHEELVRASNTENAAVFDKGKITIMADQLDKVHEVEWPDRSEVDVFYK